MEASLRNMARIGFAPGHVLDVGAYVGEWTRMCRRVFPASRVLMFEPQPERKAGLEALCREDSNVELNTSLLGRVAQDAVTFRLLETGSSIYATGRHANAPTVSLPMTTLGAAVRGTPFARPDLIKIDVQGAELDVFAGGWDVVGAAQAIVIEVALFAEYANAPLASEVIRELDDRQFRPYDICTIWRNTPTRSADQADMIFVRNNSPLFEKRHYLG
jgi:FkbM family methyltransferase